MHNTLTGLGLRERIKVGCAGKVITAFDMARTMALGADWCNAARGFMFALGCIQAQTCHTGHCPTGVTTQDPHAPESAGGDRQGRARVSASTQNTLKALKELVQAAGLMHPQDISAFHIVRRAANDEVRLLANVLPFVEPGSLLGPSRGDGDWPHAVFKLYWSLASADSFAAQLPKDATMPAPEVSTWGLLA